ncbi:DUF2423 domain containing protein [Nitzschia inconspicua]|uniref:DUF2423 domain containing protein n=1 Tax=Nitzschia inconspicua TaxID=303405 RepID=A0A9K3LC02_9STRA|nr:DUF2423 domain containing protein [Nitzschia inconspicua]
MAKSIRSKCKRKARAEFRNTIGNEFYQKHMAKVQEKMKDCLEKQTMSMDSLERLSNALHTATADEQVDDAMQDDTTPPSPPIVQLSEELLAAKELKGENKATTTIHKKGKRRSKHSVKNNDHKKESKEKRRPRYFVQF